MLHFQKWKLILALSIIVAGFLFALPNLFPATTMLRLPGWLPHKQVNLGLDLQGGAHLLYQLDRLSVQLFETPSIAVPAPYIVGEGERDVSRSVDRHRASIEAPIELCDSS